MPVILAKAEKLNHADTVLYEISMLRFASERLKREQWEHPRDAWVYLESFLLHYRNLIEFLGKEDTKKKKGKRADTLSVMTIWRLLNVSPPNDVDKIHAEGAKLLAEYEEVEDRISRYVSHCTTKRTEAKGWPIPVMIEKIEPLLAQIEPVLESQSANRLLSPVRPVFFLGPHDASTTTGTFTAVMPMLIDRFIFPEEPK
jgi:hypothetical protein